MLSDLVAKLQQSTSILHKQDIQTAASTIGQYVKGVDGSQIRLGDDCAAILDSKSYLLLAAEGIWPQLIEQDPWFAGWCAIMVNLSDIAAMGGTPIAVVDALWRQSAREKDPLWAGLQAAATAYNVPIVGGHTNAHSPYNGLSVAVLGRSHHLLTSFDAQPGDILIALINMAGTYRRDYPFWNAATTADPHQLRQQLALLPKLAATGLCNTAKDISMGGLAGTLLMLCEASGCGAVIDLDNVPRPEAPHWQEIGWHKWLTSFPSFGFLLSAAPQKVQQIVDLFSPHNLTCQPIGMMLPGPKVFIQQNAQRQQLWDLAQPLTGFSPLAKA